MQSPCIKQTWNLRGAGIVPCLSSLLGNGHDPERVKGPEEQESPKDSSFPSVISAPEKFFLLSLA